MPDRRAFLRIAASGAIGIAAAGCRAGTEYDMRALAHPELLDSLGPAAVRAIGTRYRSMNAAPRSADDLREAILASRPFSTRFLGAPGPPLAQLVRDDFANGRTVVVDGWILSATEARQCALFSLQPA